MKKYLIILLGVVGCSNNPIVVEKFPQDPYIERKEHAGNLFGNKDGIIVFQDKQNKTEKQTKTENNLWDKTLSEISKLFPITSIDKNNGLILTDWTEIQSISGNTNSYKANIVVNQNNLNITIFEKNNKGQNINNSKITKKIKELILK